MSTNRLQVPVPEMETVGAAELPWTEGNVKLPEADTKNWLLEPKPTIYGDGDTLDPTDKNEPVL